MNIIYELEEYMVDFTYHKSYILFDAELNTLFCSENMKLDEKNNVTLINNSVSVIAVFRDKFGNSFETKLATLNEDYNTKSVDIVKDYTETIKYFINVNRTKTVTEKDIIFFCRATLEFEPICNQGKYKYDETVKDIVEKE